MAQVEIRPLQDADLECLRRWRTDPSVDKWLEEECPAISPEQQRAWWARRKGNEKERWFAILSFIIEEEWRIVGWAQIVGIEGGRAEIGQVVAENRNQGIGTIALQKLLDECRGLGISAVEAHVLPFNLAAMNLYIGGGFRPEGYEGQHCDKGAVIRWVKHLT